MAMLLGRKEEVPMGSTGDHYRGLDRRHGIGATPMSKELIHAAILIALAVVWIGAGLVAAHVIALRDAATLASRINAASGTLGLVAGATALLRWRLNKTAPAWWSGCALLIIGAAVLATGSPEIPRLEATTVTAAAFMVALSLFVKSLYTPDVDASISFLKAALFTTIALAITFVCSIAITNAGYSMILEVAVAAGYAVCALLLIQNRHEKPDLIWLAPCLIALGSASLISAVLDTGMGVLGYTTFLCFALSSAAVGEIWSVTTVAESNRSIARNAQLDHVQAEERLREVEGARAKLLHEARSSVTSIAGGMRMLEDTQGDSRVPSAIAAELDRLSELLNQGNSHVDHVIGRFALAECLTPVLELFAASGWQVSWNLDSEALVYGRPAGVAQIIHHLISNARRHAVGSPIAVRTYVNGERLHVAVEDRGPGIPQAERERIFDPGVRLNKGTQGDGLGLAIAREIANEMLAELWVEPRTGGGTSFVLALRQSVASDRHDVDLPLWRAAT